MRHPRSTSTHPGTIVNRSPAIATHMLPLPGACAFACVGGERGGLPFAKHPSSSFVRHQMRGNEDRVQPGEDVA
jgi:hypothetical protein